MNKSTSKLMVSALVVGLFSGASALANHEAGHEGGKDATKKEMNGCCKNGCGADKMEGGKCKDEKHHKGHDDKAKTETPASKKAEPPPAGH